MTLEQYSVQSEGTPPVTIQQLNFVKIDRETLECL